MERDENAIKNLHVSVSERVPFGTHALTHIIGKFKFSHMQKGMIIVVVSVKRC